MFQTKSRIYSLFSYNSVLQSEPSSAMNFERERERKNYVRNYVVTRSSSFTNYCCCYYCGSQTTRIDVPETCINI